MDTCTKTASVFNTGRDGKEVLSDPSHYTYEEVDPEERRLNRWALSSASHNTLLLNGEGQRRLPLRLTGDRKDYHVPDLRAGDQGPLPFRTVSNSEVSFVEGVYADGTASCPNALHHRQLLDLHGVGWLVLDWVQGADRATRCWHFAPGYLGKLEITDTQVTGPDFQLAALNGVDQSDTLLEEHFPDYAVKETAQGITWENQLKSEVPLVTWFELSLTPLEIQQGECSLTWTSGKGPCKLTWEAEGYLYLETPSGILTWHRTDASIRLNGVEMEKLPSPESGKHASTACTIA